MCDLPAFVASLSAPASQSSSPFGHSTWTADPNDNKLFEAVYFLVAFTDSHRDIEKAETEQAAKMSGGWNTSKLLPRALPAPPPVRGTGTDKNHRASLTEPPPSHKAKGDHVANPPSSRIRRRSLHLPPRQPRRHRRPIRRAHLPRPHRAPLPVPRLRRHLPLQIPHHRAPF